MKNIIFFVIVSMIGYSLSRGGNPIVWYYDHNNEIPGSTYSFSFVHVSDIHIGEGDPDGDYGTFGYLDSMPNGDVGAPAERLRSSVAWINANYIEKNLKFVIVSGDITDSGEKSEFFKAKQILDDLLIPYVPLIGNHDVWPYIKGDSAREAPYPYGDSILNEIYSGVFDSLQGFFDSWNNGTRLIRGWNEEGGTTAYLQNYVASFQGNHFIFLDFDPRYHAVFPPGPGIGPEAQLHDYLGGTLQWLKSTLESLPGKRDKNLFLISHHPPAKDIWAFVNAFSLDELVKIAEVLKPFRQHLGIWFAGHIHRNEQYILNASGQIPLIQCLEVESNKEQPFGALRVVNVYNVPISTGLQAPLVANILKVIPNPSRGSLRLQYPPELKGTSLLNIIDASGKTVYSNTAELDGSVFNIDMENPTAGMYIIKLEQKGKIYTTYVVID